MGEVKSFTGPTSVDERDTLSSYTELVSLISKIFTQQRTHHGITGQNARVAAVFSQVI